MVFGQVGGEVLHNGARGNQPYLGHWGDDVGGGSINLDRWTHYAWTFNGSGAPGEIAIYQDGVQIASATASTPNCDIRSSKSMAFSSGPIGVRRTVSTGPPSRRGVM